MGISSILGMAASFFISSPQAVINFEEAAIPDEGQYVVYVEPKDFGAAVVKIVIKVREPVSSQLIDKNDFIIKACYSSDAILGGTGLKGKEKIIEDAYISDCFGNKTADSTGKYIAFDMYNHPDDELSSPFTKMNSVGFNEVYKYKIENDRLNISVSQPGGLVCPEAAKFKDGSKSYKIPKLTDPSAKDLITHNYTYYMPETTGSIPLIIWLHGVTEGGSNPYLPLLGIKSTALGDEKIQKYFKNGAAVLVPQSPTTWLETNSLDPMGNRMWSPVDIGSYAKKITGPIDNFLMKLSGETEEQDFTPVANVSYYTETLKNLIDDFVAENPRIDKNRIYIGGCSAGGYMTMNMIIQYPDYFAAAFPVCQVYCDSKIPVSDIKKLASMPIWFTYAQNDKTVPPKDYSEATITRIMREDRSKLRFTVYQKVVDETGTIKTENGEPYEYPGHLSWIPVLNDESTYNGEKLFSWLSQQSK